MNDFRNQVLIGDVRERLRQLPDGCCQTCCTSPPYWGLRSYLPADDPLKALEMGSEPTPEAYVVAQVEVFREVRRVLRDDGTLWLNIGDGYAGSSMSGGDQSTRCDGGKLRLGELRKKQSHVATPCVSGLKPKDLCGIPWRLALALQADGWYLRSEIIWAKPNPMPESVTDRPTKAHEQVFLLTKRARYFYDAEAVREDARNWGTRDRSNTDACTVGVMPNGQPHKGLRDINFAARGRNLRSVWHIPTESYTGSHYATFPRKLAETCILAGTSEAGCCGTRIKKLRIRKDLTEEERAKVYARLGARAIV